MKKNFPLLSLGILFLVFLWFFGESRQESRDFVVPFFRGASGLKNFFTTKKSLLQRIEELERENQRLGLIPIEDKALVLSQSPATPYDTLIVAAGREDGIQAGFKALAYGGILLGRVEESGERTSLIKLVSFPGLQSEAWLERLALNVTLEGQGGYNLRFFLPKGVAVEIGDRLLSNTRPSFLVGQVERIKEKTSEPLSEIILRLPLNIRNLRYVELLP